MREDIKLEPFDQAKYEAGFQAIADEVDARVLERMIEIAKEISTQDTPVIYTKRDGTTIEDIKNLHIEMNNKETYE